MEDNTTRPEPSGESGTSGDIRSNGNPGDTGDNGSSRDQGIDPASQAAPNATEAAKRLAELEEEIKRIREQLVEEPVAEGEATRTEDVKRQPQVVEEFEIPPAVSEEDDEKVEGLIRQARLARTRQQISQASDLLKSAIEIDPGSTDAILELGDILLLQNRNAQAKALFFRASKLKPNDVTIERKYAEAVLKSSVPMDSMLRGSSGYSAEQVANAKLAAILSFFVPGAGQIVLGQTVKGAIILGAWLISVIVTVAIPHGFKALLAPNADYTILLPIGATLALCIYSTFDALSVAKVDKHTKRDRPKPPVDLPFEYDALSAAKVGKSAKPGPRKPPVG